MRVGRRGGILELLCVVLRAGREMTTDTILLDSVNDPERVEAKLGGGTLCAFSAPAPEKTTGNEDCVAAIPYGPNAVILVVADGAGGLPGGRKAT